MEGDNPTPTETAEKMKESNDHQIEETAQVAKTTKAPKQAKSVKTEAPVSDATGGSGQLEEHGSITRGPLD